MAGNINANFLHHLNGERMNIAGGLGPRALHVERIARHRAQNAFGKMAAARIARAEDEDSRFHFRHWRLHSSAGSCLRIVLSCLLSSKTRGLSARTFSIQSRALRTTTGAALPGSL